jgi:hypothetical protein
MRDPQDRLDGTVMGSALTAAKEIHIALCNNRNVMATRALLRALHNVLIIAEEGRQSIEQKLDEDERKELSDD